MNDLNSYMLFRQKYTVKKIVVVTISLQGYVCMFVHVESCNLLTSRCKYIYLVALDYSYCCKNMKIPLKEKSLFYFKYYISCMLYPFFPSDSNSHVPQKKKNPSKDLLVMVL